MKYIDADKIRNAIESEADNWQDTYTDCMRDNLLTILDSLQQEQPDVDIREEIKKLEFMGSNDARDIEAVAKHFYELGLKSK